MPNSPLSHLKERVGVIRAESPNIISVPWLRQPSACTTRVSRVQLEMPCGVRQTSSLSVLPRTAVLGAEPCLPIRESAARSMGLFRKPGWLIVRMPRCRRKQYSGVQEQSPSPHTNARTPFAVFSSRPPPKTPPTWPQSLQLSASPPRHQLQYYQKATPQTQSLWRWLFHSKPKQIKSSKLTNESDLPLSSLFCLPHIFTFLKLQSPRLWKSALNPGGLPSSLCPPLPPALRNKTTPKTSHLTPGRVRAGAESTPSFSAKIQEWRRQGFLGSMYLSNSSLPPLPPLPPASCLSVKEESLPFVLLLCLWSGGGSPRLPLVGTVTGELYCYQLWELIFRGQK